MSADVKNATFTSVPRSLQPADALPWPALTQLSGELVIDRTQLQVKGGRGKMGATTGVQISKLEAAIPDLNKATVTVTAEARGALNEGLPGAGCRRLACSHPRRLRHREGRVPPEVRLSG